MSGSVNVTTGEKEDRLMMTGMHTVVDIFCVGCGSIVGWKYVRPNQEILLHELSFYLFIDECCVCYLMNFGILILIIDIRRLHTKNPNNTRRENLFLRGIQLPSVVIILFFVLLFRGWLREILLVSRFKVLGPDGSVYVNQDIQVGGVSDGEDA